MDDPLAQFVRWGAKTEHRLRVRSRTLAEVSYEVIICLYSQALTVHCGCLGAGNKQNMCHHKRSLLRGDPTILASDSFRPILTEVLRSPGFLGIQKVFESNDLSFRESEERLVPLRIDMDAIKKRFAAEIKPSGGAPKT